MKKAMETVNELLVDIFNRILFIEEKAMKKAGVTISMTEIHILENVEKSETKTLTDVSRLQGVTPGTLSVAVNSLTRKGYINKCRDIQDKRVIRLFLTAKAKEVLVIHGKFHDLMVQKVVEDLDLESQHEVINGLVQIAEYFKNQFEKLEVKGQENDK